MIKERGVGWDNFVNAPKRHPRSLIMRQYTIQFTIPDGGPEVAQFHLIVNVLMIFHNFEVNIFFSEALNHQGLIFWREYGIVFRFPIFSSLFVANEVKPS